MEKSIKVGVFFAVLSATLYALNAPFSKLLLAYLSPTLMAGFLYIGAGVGMVGIALCRRVRHTQSVDGKLTKRDLPFVVLMIVLDIVAPICLLFGLRLTTASNASLLNNFEIVATAIIALMVFKEKISARLWVGIAFVVSACLLLSFEDITSLQFSIGSIFILLACVSWGLENNCTRKISASEPLQIVLLKGVFSGVGSVIIGLIIGERVLYFWSVLAVMTVGFVAYGLSIFFYVHAQRRLGATRTSAYYAVAPFIATLLSLLIFREIPKYNYFIALGLMIVGAWLCANDEKLFKKRRKK